MLQFIGVETRERTKDLRKSLADTRRSHFGKDEVKYREAIKQMMDGENIASQSIIKEALPILNIAVADFTANLDRMAADPKTAEFVMAA